MKQLEVTRKEIGEAVFYIKPFPAFTAAHISGDLANLVAPLFGGIAGAFGNSKSEDIMNMEIDEALPSVSSAFSNLSGDKFERLMKKLLIEHKNISVECEATGGETKVLTYDLANEVFCGEVQDMYILCFEVIRLNYKGFFKKLGARFGGLLAALKKTPRSKDTESSITDNSQNLNLGFTSS